MPSAEAVQKEWETMTPDPKEWQESTSPITSWHEVPVDITATVSPTVGIDRAPRTSDTLKAEIDRAGEILRLRDDWDGEGSVGYSAETLTRATRFVSGYVSHLWESFAIDAPVPTFGPGPDGSIDVHWKLPRWELLVNIPSDRNTMATFYGDDYGEQRIHGSFDPGRFNWGIASWLIR